MGKTPVLLQIQSRIVNPSCATSSVQDLHIPQSENYGILVSL